MTRRPARRLLAAALAGSAGLAVAALGPAGSAAAGDELAETRRATAGFHRVSAAESAGYVRFPDAAGVGCIEHPTAGGMGVHYASGALVEDPTVSAGAPEVLVYAPRRGALRLVAVEHVVLQEAWHDAGNAAAPQLHGQAFTAVGADNRYGLPPYYALHVWAWERNASGTFADWNPRVDCP